MPLQVQGIGASSALTDAFAVAGKLPLALDETIVPVAILRDLDGEVWGPACVAGIEVPAGGVGTRNECEISLPVVNGSVGAAIRVDRIMVTGLIAGSSVRIGPSPGIAAPTHFGSAVWRDTSKLGLPQAITSGSNGPIGAAFSDIFRVRLDLNRNERLDLDWILGQNPDTGVQQGLMVRCGGDNQDLRVTFFFRERAPR